jgi:hypothetical protein
MLKSTRKSPSGRGHRPGFTILEFLVVFVMLGIVGGAVTMLLMRQTRFYTNNAALNESRANLRQALNVMPLELWSVSSAGGDLVAMTDSSIDFRAVIGATIVCRVESDAYITWPPVKLAKGPLTTWVNKPVPGDSVLIYDDATSSATARDDLWRAYEINTITDRVGDIKEGCQLSTGFTQLTDLITGNPAFQVVMTVKISKTILDGAPVRVFRRVRYSLFKDTDSKWYLGYSDCQPKRSPVCVPPKAVAGPFLKYNPPNASEKSGLTFTYYDSTGAETTNPMAVSRINVMVRAAPDFAASDNYYKSSDFVDSLRFDIALRNRK